jgi:hypothetical protein
VLRLILLYNLYADVTVCAKNFMASTTCTPELRRCQCTDIFLLTISFAGTEFKIINMFGEEVKTTNATDILLEQPKSPTSINVK